MSHSNDHLTAIRRRERAPNYQLLQRIKGYYSEKPPARERRGRQKRTHPQGGQPFLPAGQKNPPSPHARPGAEAPGMGSPSRHTQVRS